MAWTLPDIVPNFPMLIPPEWEVVPRTTMPGQLEAGIWEVPKQCYMSTQYGDRHQGTYSTIAVVSKDVGSGHTAHDISPRHMWASLIFELWNGSEDFQINRFYLRRWYMYTVNVEGVPYPVRRNKSIDFTMQVKNFETLTDGRLHWEAEGSATIHPKDVLPVDSGDTVSGDVKDTGVTVSYDFDFPTGNIDAKGGMLCQWTTRPLRQNPSGGYLEADVNGDNFANGLDVAQVQSSANYGKNILAAHNPLCDVNCDGLINGLDVAALTSSGVYGTPTN